MTALRHIRFHAGENGQAVFQFQSIVHPPADGREILVKVMELERVEMLCQAQRVKTGATGFPKKPVGIGRGKWQFLCQLSMGVKIKSQEKPFLQKRVEKRTESATHKKETAKKSRSL